MDKKLKRIIRRNGNALKASDKRLCTVFEIMFYERDNVLCEQNDGFRIRKYTYGEVYDRIVQTAGALYARIGAQHAYVALEMDNSCDWIVAFWAILMSGNKPYLVNMRYPNTLTDGILQTLGVRYIVCERESALRGESICLSSLTGGGDVPSDAFEDELAFSSSATSMNEVVCFYHGFQISEQILNFESIIRAEPRMAKHYKGHLKQLAFLPFYHVFGLFAVYFWFTFFGRTLVFLRDYGADTILKTCRKHEVTHIFAVPVLWHTIEKQVLATAQQDAKTYRKLQRGLKLTTALQNVCPSLGTELSKRILHEVTDRVFGKSVMFTINGGSYLRDSALYLLNGIGYSLHNGYGMSEIGITSVELGRTARERNRNAIGKPFDSVEYRLDEDGVLLVRGSSLCTKKTVNGVEQTFDGWFRTGDRMRCEDGTYFILGRESDVVIGENGENINPDVVEKLFALPKAKTLSVLGLAGENGQELALVVQIAPFASEETVTALRNEAYAINDTLPATTAVKRFYFTVQELCPPTAIKVGRPQLLRKIEAGEITLVPFAEMRAASKEDASALTAEVCGIVAQALGLSAEEVTADSHIFNDLGATSIQYFSALTALAEKFGIADYGKTDTYCYTPREIAKYIERRL